MPGQRDLQHGSEAGQGKRARACDRGVLEEGADAAACDFWGWYWFSAEGGAHRRRSAQEAREGYRTSCYIGREGCKSACRTLALEEGVVSRVCAQLGLSKRANFGGDLVIGFETIRGSDGIVGVGAERPLCGAARRRTISSRFSVLGLTLLVTLGMALLEQPTESQ